MTAVAALQGEIKKSRASLVGGIVVGIGVMVLWVAVAGELGSVRGWPLIAGGVTAVLVAAWIWKADL